MSGLISSALGAVRQFGATFSSSITPTLGVGSTMTTFSAPLFGVIGGIFVILLIVYIIVLYGSIRPTNTVIGPVDLFTPKNPVVVSRDQTQSLMSATYTLAFYLRVDAVPDMRAESIPLMTWPSVWNLGYNPAHEELVFTINSGGSSSTVDTTTIPVLTTGAVGITGENVYLPNVPPQKWIQVVLTFEGRTMDMYVNGTLSKSYTLKHLPAPPKSSITLVPKGVMGQLAYVQVWSKRLRISEVASNYTDTCDSRGQPYLPPEFVTALQDVSWPSLFCPGGDCGTTPTASASQRWDFPYA